MSGVATLQLREDMLKRYWRGEALEYDRVQVALCRTVPAANASLSQLDEPTGGAYARVTAVFPSTSYWVLGTGGEISLGLTLTFPTASASWGLIPGWALLSAKSAGAYTQTVLALGRLTQPLRVIAGIRPRLQPGSISFSLLDSA